MNGAGLVSMHKKLIVFILMSLLLSCGWFEQGAIWEAGFSEKACYAEINIPIEWEDDRYHISFYLDMFTLSENIQPEIDGLGDIKQGEKIISAYIPISDFENKKWDEDFYPDKVFVNIGSQNFDMYFKPAGEKGIGRFFVVGDAAEKIWEALKLKQNVVFQLNIKSIGERLVQVPHTGIDTVSAMYEACKDEMQIGNTLD